MRLHHVAYLVKDVENAIKAFESLGYVTTSLINEDPIKYDPHRDCDIVFMYHSSREGDEDKDFVELVSPKSEESPVYGLMAKYKNGPYHLCFSSDDPEGDIEEMKKNGWMVIQEDAPAVAFGEKHVTFLMHRQIGIMELVYQV